MRISDWSSDVCSSDLGARDVEGAGELELRIAKPRAKFGDALEPENVAPPRPCGQAVALGLAGGVGGVGVVGPWRVVPNRSLSLRAKRRVRKSVVSGNSVSVRVDLGGGLLLIKK